MSTPRIAIVGAGAVGGYAGAYMAQAGHDVTFVDPWPEHVEAMRARGLTIQHLKDVPEFTVPVKAIHITELQSFAKQRLVDIAFICMKSYDTAWATAMVAQYLAPGGYVVSLQNCINEEVIAGVVGWGRVLGAIASLITVELAAPGLVKRAAGKSGAAHTVYRVGEPHGRITPRAEMVTSLLALSDSALTTTNLWGERWSKLVANVMGNGIAAATGMVAKDATADDAIRAFAARLGSEAIRVGQALGYELEEILHLDPEIIARAGEGDAEARAAYDAQRLADTQKPGGGAHRASMGQDMVKGRRTEIEFLNGFVVAKGREVGIAAPANAALTEIVKRVERGEAQPSPDLIRALRLN
ncbi:2-dehydropantoate 2-reductase [Roseomonas alkaliterrae]|uniref:2-dehydropantoate 2-reductase n=1 Tax=Neoroseomonas alkaliterrae TaxID=1452450 RepID=A0A840XWF2_9PROT|nr:2-dehydropantoate 2-reductase [Neoroseomonas alkaliterrae]MBB5690959.1 2-dehydropantoate 2-reductase [Neoroseomonas alkaliterrae]MBR0674666.1 2-dehydropantoate 2-reductase [Neoroseomonas alkaliterrae]